MSKAKQAILDSYLDNFIEDHEDEEESGSYQGQADEEDDNKSEEEEEELESLEEEYEYEESDSDQEGDVESNGCSDEDEYYESISDDEGNEDDGDKFCDWKEGKPTDKDHCDIVVNLLRQRSKKLDVLKLEECKAYLRKHDLMISGTKATCIRRIIEHWRLKGGNGVRLYPKSSFTINCTGDVCKGDVVMFKQRVYDKFNKVSRNGKVIGKRTIAGMVVKESYGSAKQQHTFTVEVLWNKGVKPLPSLYPLRVKGRNLYRYRTFRQRWANEADRSKVLEEKHRRGATARHVRASTKARVSAEGSKGQKSLLTDSKQHQIKRQKKSSEASTSGKKQPKTYNAKAHVKYSSNNNLKASSSSAKHSKMFKTKTSSYTNIRQVDQSAQRHSQNIYDISHPDLHQMNRIAASQVGSERFLIPVYNYNHNPGHIVQLMNRGRNIRPPYSVYASQFDHRGHLSHHYSNSISPYDSRSSGHVFTPDFYDPRYAGSQFQGSNRPWPL